MSVMVISQVQLKTGERLPMLLDGDGMPVVSPCEWVLANRHRSLNTLRRNISELVPLYIWLNQNQTDLFELIRSGRYWTEAQINSLAEALRRSYGKRGGVVRLVVRPDTANKRLSTVARYLSWCFDVVLSDPDLGAMRRDVVVQIQCKVISALRQKYINPEPKSSAVRKGLAQSQVDFLQEVLHGDVGTRKNPTLRLRDYLITTFMVLYGLRPGEVLSLRVQDLEFGALSNVRVRRRRPSLEDVRSRPASVKRAGRILVLDNSEFARALDLYTMNGREQAVHRAGSKATNYLFLSRDGKPLSESSVQDIFKNLRSTFPQRLPANLTARSLRHVFTTGLFNELKRMGVEEGEAQEILMYVRGDTAPASQNTYIDLRERAERALKAYWDRISPNTEVCGESV